MSENTSDELLAADIEALCVKHNLESSMIAVTRDNHFLIIACNMSPNILRILGLTLMNTSAPPPDALLN